MNEIVNPLKNEYCTNLNLSNDFSKNLQVAFYFLTGL
jgi:hypothetical protein